MTTTSPTPRPWARIEATGGVVLRRPTAADRLGLFRVHADPAVYAYDPHETHTDLRHTDLLLAPVLAHWATHGFGYWSVLAPRAFTDGAGPGDGGEGGDPVIVGLGGIQHRTVSGHPALNVYFRFAPAAQGRGLARTLLREVHSLAPIVAPGTDVVVRTRPANAAARHVAERAGFVDEGLEPGTTDMQLLRYRF